MKIRSGSVKSNIGHLEGASGVVGVIKTILALEKGVVPPNANFERLNPRIDAEFLNIKVSDRPINFYSSDKWLAYLRRSLPKRCRGLIKACVVHLSNPLASAVLTAM